jgi:protein-disulfide isomerase
MPDHENILEGTVAEIKEAVRERDLNPEILLELEKMGKDRKTLKEFLEEQIEDDTAVPEPVGAPLSVNQALVIVFALGLAVGFVAGLTSPLETGMTLTGTPADNQQMNNNNNQISGESTMAAIKDIADSVGVDGDQVESCVNTAGEAEINEDKGEIIDAVGGIGTPTFFIGNSEIGYKRVSGAQPYSVMKSTIEEQLQDARDGDTTIDDEEHTLLNISLADEPTLGDEDAPITIIEYSDYGCPWCAEWHGVDAITQRPIDQENSFEQVRSNHVENGEVFFVLKDFPVPQLHPDAMTAHKAAGCVYQDSPENYWEFSEKLYEERDRWKG